MGWSDRPIYRHRQHGEHLFYLQSRSKGLWMIGPKVNSKLIIGWVVGGWVVAYSILVSAPVPLELIRF